MVDYLSNVRLAAGTLSQYVLEGSSSYVVNNFPRQSDMWPAIQWEAVSQGRILRQTIAALDGTGNFYGGATGALEFFILTNGMLDYLWTNIMQSKPRNSVTLRTYHHELGWTVYNAKLIWPFESGGDAIQQDINLYSNIVFPFERATVADYGRSFSAAFSSAFD